MKRTILLGILLTTVSVFGQNGAEIYKQLLKLNTLSSVLYVAAHPDDENTRLISLFSNHYNARTAYLSMTRGDGGQNLIGTELRESLGLIRTQELLEARKLDGGEQFFTTANDFGYSKHPDETLAFWDREAILSQIVYRIRWFQPDLIIHRFNHQTPGTTHGHHTSSAILSEEAFHLANDPNAFPEQLNRVELWQPKRQFYNTSWWAYGSREKFEQADKSNMIRLESNPMDPIMGRSNEEVASKSRSQHKSQGFGSSPGLGSQEEYIELINGSPLKNNDPFHGIETGWKRVKGGSEIQILMEEILTDFSLEKPYLSVPKLLTVYQKIKSLENKHWRTLKSQEVRKIIKNCLGLRLQFNTSEPTGVANTSLDTRYRAVNPSPLSVSIVKIEGEAPFSQTKVLKQNRLWQQKQNMILPQSTTTPYWLLEKGNIGNYRVQNEELKGLPETNNPIVAEFTLRIEGINVPFSVPLTYRTTDRVDGEVIENFQLVPKITTQLNESVILFDNETAKPVRVQVQSNSNQSKGVVELIAPQEWKINPPSHPFSIDQKGASQEFIFEVTPPKGNSTALFTSKVTQGEESYDMKLEVIEYPHISKQYLVAPNESKAVKVDLKTKVNHIAYLKGAGDKVAESLRNIGIQVTEFNIEDLRLEKITPFPTLVVGIRAFNVHQSLSFKNKILWEYVALGGTVIVQYNTSRGLNSSLVGPYPLRFSRDRVTDELAKVTVLDPKHPLMNNPNKITPTDFDGWVQERGLYFASNWDSNYIPLLSMNDKGESPKSGSLLVSDYGKGKFIFTGLSFFRELPAGVPGAYRLFVNLISYGH
ncbi:MAG: PIG-L family deacetylase [Flavobacteriaceae bacterium]